jgi:hypothetical protein
MHKKSIKIEYLLLLSLCFWIISAEPLWAQGLETPNTNRIRAQIDSVVSSLDIEVASVCFKVVDNFLDNTSTTTSCAISRKPFTIHNGFLEFEDSFYNLDKLLFFRIEKDTRTKKPYLEFYFQYY